MQTTVITEKQARQITGGRRPLVPVEYEQAVKSLRECVDLDEAKYWSDAADALAAWAKIYHDKEHALLAMKLRARAAHRMGELSLQLHPGRSRAALIDRGLTKDAAARCLRLGRAPKDKVEKAIESGRGLQSIAGEFRGLAKAANLASSDSWHWLNRSPNGPRLSDFLHRLKERRARDVAASLSPGEFRAAKKVVCELQEYLDEFEQYLPKEN